MQEKIHVTNGTKYSKMGQGKILECILKADGTPFLKAVFHKFYMVHS